MLSSSKMKSISFSGHRYFDMSLDGEPLRNTIDSLVASGEQLVFWSGMAVGFDLAAAEVVLSHIDRGADATLCCAVPYIAQHERFSPSDRALYDYVMSRADRIETLSDHYRPDIFMRRNDLLVDRCDLLVAYYDGEGRGGTAYTVKRALRRGVKVENIYPQQQLSLF